MFICFLIFSAGLKVITDTDVLSVIFVLLFLIF